MGDVNGGFRGLQLSHLDAFRWRELNAITNVIRKAAELSGAPHLSRAGCETKPSMDVKGTSFFAEPAAERTNQKTLITDGP